MELQTILKADYLDIIFDKRNKQYGGYELRKHYNQRMGKACALLLLLLCGITCISFVNTPDAVNHIPSTMPVRPTIIETNPDVTPPPPEHILPPPAPDPVKTRTITPPVITDDPFPDDKTMTPNDELKNAVLGLTNSDGDSTGISIEPTKGSGGGAMVIAEPKPEAPRRFVEQMPLFSGDMAAYIATHIHYPEMARANGIEGKVVVEFVVNEDGAVSNARVVRSIGSGCDEEALRMVSGMPHWKPGKQNGIPVKVYFTLPIKFELN